MKKYHTPHPHKKIIKSGRINKRKKEKGIIRNRNDK